MHVSTGQTSPFLLQQPDELMTDLKLEDDWKVISLGMQKYYYLKWSCRTFSRNFSKSTANMHYLNMGIG